MRQSRKESVTRPAPSEQSKNEAAQEYNVANDELLKIVIQEESKLGVNIKDRENMKLPTAAGSIGARKLSP